MIFSLGLLLVLQYFWITGSYENEREQLRREATSLFRTTLLAHQDSLIQKRIRVIPDSSAIRMNKAEFWHSRLADSTSDSDQTRTAKVQIMVSGDPPDSLSAIFRPIAERMQAGQRNFVVRLDRDTINTDSLHAQFMKALGSIEAGMPFTVIRLKRGEEVDANRGLYIDPVRFPPFERYTVLLSKPAPYVWKKISPQIFFSLFLTLVTSSAFMVMYRSLRAQEKLMAIKNDFISNVTHELKTPVATVSVAIEALKNFHALDNPAKTAEYLDIAQNELSRLTLMTDKILKTAVFENQQLSFQVEQIDLVPLVQAVLNSLKLIAEKQGVILQFKKREGNYVIAGDAAHLTNMVYNLVDNALKYGGIDIRVTLEPHGRDVLLAIRDNGIGINPEYHKKIFEKFFRVPTGDVHNSRGYGLGLSYVANVVERHGGSVKIESEIKKGSIFRIYLPREHAQS